MHTDFHTAQERHDNALPAAEVGPEPTKAQIEQAFDELVADTETMMTYIEERGIEDATTAFQLYHAHGLPSMDCSEKDDELRDRYETAFSIFLDDYRAWLESPYYTIDQASRLRMRADALMEREREEAREEAEDAAADSRREDQHLNGGW